MNHITVTELTIYPVKSLRGISLQQSLLTSEGLQHDRRWMVVREDGRFVTQRDWPAIALIETTMENDGVVLSRQGYGKHKLYFDASQSQALEGNVTPSKVWKDPVETSDEGDAVSAWLSTACASKYVLRLVRMAPGFTRKHNDADLFGTENATKFADASPYLFANQGSLDALNAELQARGHGPVPMNRFRANVVVQGLPAFSERTTGTLSGESYSFGLRAACERCVVPNIDQDTAIKDPQQEPFKTLTDINPMPGKRAPAFAENSVLTSGAGRTIHVGDVLQPGH